MKKIYILSALMALMLSACSDSLDIKPSIGTTSDDVYSTFEGYNKAIAKVYSSFTVMGSERGGGSAFISANSSRSSDLFRVGFYLQEVPTDECAYKWMSGDNMTNMSFQQWDPTDPYVNDAYYFLYYTIAVANEFLRYTDDSHLSSFSDAERAAIMKYALEARFIRAYAYWWVLDLYRQGPYVDQDTPMTGFIPEAYDGRKLYDFIKGEIDEIAPNMEANPQYGRAGQGAAYALGARLALNGEVYTGQSHATEAIEYCKKVLGLGYSLEKDYYKLFNAENDKRTNEVIFGVAIDSKNSSVWGSTTNLVQGSALSDDDYQTLYGIDSAWGNYSMRGEITSLFDADNDSRYLFVTQDKSEFFTGSLETTNEGYRTYKWTNLKDDGSASCTTENGVDTDLPLIRLSEVYLTAAEAVLRGGTGMSRSEALDLVNAVRERAYGDASGNIKDDEFDLSFMIEELGREFYFEMHRRTDLVRFGLFTGGSYLWQWKGGVLDGRAVNDRYNIYPIPQAELSANPNLKNEKY